VCESTVYLADLRAVGRGWSKQEVSHLHRAASVLWRGGVSLETDSGVTDEGDPWFVFCDAESGDVLVHFARIGGAYVVCAPLLDGSLTARVLPELVDRFLERYPRGRLTSLRNRSTPAA
jgi:hypothetical protein